MGRSKVLKTITYLIGMTAGEASQIGNLNLHLLILIKLPKHTQTMKSSLLFFEWCPLSVFVVS